MYWDGVPNTLGAIANELCSRCGALSIKTLSVATLGSILSRLRQGQVKHIRPFL